MIKNILNNKDKNEINLNYYKLFNHYNQKYKLEELRALRAPLREGSFTLQGR